MLSPAEQQQVSKGLEKNAEVMTNTHLEELLAGQPADVKAEIIHINTVARPRALQIALLIPLLAALLGLFNGFRMTRLPGPRAFGGGRGRARRLKRYLTSVSSLNIGRYIEMMITPTIAPTPIIISGSMMAVSEAIAASTSSS